MLLSVAIRLGSLLGPQAKGLFHDSRSGGMCAFGAGLAAIGKLKKGEGWLNHDLISQAWPYVDTKVSVPYEYLPPISENYCNATIRSVVVGMNNRGGWTREQCADWVEEQERKLGLWDAVVEQEEAVNVL